MTPSRPKPFRLRHGLQALLCLLPTGAFALPTVSFASYPLFLAPAVRPNIMIIFDNSQSMDATMAGKMISGDDPTTRGNVARGVLRSVLESYRDAFNWGLTTFETSADTLYTTHAYYLGDSTTMVYTNDCILGISATNGGRRCIANPDSNPNNRSYLTYARSGDDADINDVLYSGSTASTLYGIGDSGTKFFIRGAPRKNTTGWDIDDFPTAGPFGGGSITFSATDAGFVPTVSATPREVYIKRGWGYNGNITGKGKIVETVQADSTTHFNKLISLLGSETNTATAEVKNSAVYTPLTGSLKTVSDYFKNTTSQTPITQTCQRNFVVMATDGNPTGKTDGSQYSPSQWVNTFNSASGTWSYGAAVSDVFAQISGLRSTTLGTTAYDIQTYVIGLGDTVANAGALAGLNRMAELGGGYATAFSGSNATALTNAFAAIVGDIQAKTSAASSAALNGGSWNTGAVLYQAKFNSSDWSGNLLAYPIQASGVVGSTANWDAATQLRAQNWNTGRKILTYKPSSARGIALRWPLVQATPLAAELDVAQSSALDLNAAGTSDGYGRLRLQFLRGEATYEPRNCASPPCAAPQFNNRNSGPLGDIVNSSPYYVGGPNFGYYDDMESVAYSSFVSTYRSRAPMIYVGGNDGMLHAFNVSTGAEALAYVPSPLFSSLSLLTDLNYSHRYYADGTPTVGDAFYNGAWRTLLVSGLRSGGKGLFALDVTDPSNFSEANATSIVRWEFQDADMGYVFGQPLIVKTNNGRWSIVVSGGYNHGNANGHAYLFVIDAETGALVKKIDTGAGTAASPNGLSPAAAVDTNGDGVADVVYAGDLDGNLWKFNLTSTTATSWAMGNGGLPLFTATGQSITSRPDITKFKTGGYLIGFGTGRYLATADTTDTTSQALYAVRDTLANGTVTLAQLQRQSISQIANGGDGNTYRLSTHAVDPPSDPTITGDNALTLASFNSTKKGWYLTLPTAGERVVANARFRGGRIVFTSLIPDVSTPCAYGGSGWVMEFDAMTGNRLDTATFDTNGDNKLQSKDNGLLVSDFLSFPGDAAGVKHNTSGRKISAIPAAPGFMSNQDGSNGLEDKYINTSDGTVVRVRETAGKGAQGRVMWREVR